MEKAEIKLAKPSKRISINEKEDWKAFCDLISQAFCHENGKGTLEKPYIGDYVWRGHRYEDYNLVSSFDRVFEKDNGNFVYDPDRNKVLKRHLNSFAYAVRSRLKEFGLTVREIKAAIKNKFLNENHIWALGQHYGLKTPLLDWCYSPYVAAYFAFQKQKDRNNNHCRIVWGLNYKQVCDNYTKDKVFNTGIEYFDPMSSEHPRLINQRGLFTIKKTKNGEAVKKFRKNDIDIEGTVENNECANCNAPWLVKLKIIDSKENRQEFLRRLNAMNINHMSLFPEIYGSAKFCNIGIEDGLDDYAVFHGQDV